MNALQGFNMHEAETGLVQRLKEISQTGDDAWARKIGTRDYLASVAEEMQSAPAVYVVYDGRVIHDADEQRSAWSHRWLVVLAVATASADMRETAPRNQDAGPFIGCLVMGLIGYRPPGCTHGLVEAPAPRPYFSPGGKFAYYPLAFTAAAMFSTRFGLAGAKPT